MLDDGADGTSPPLRGVVLCSTSLSQELRAKLGDIANHMGAIHRLDLTADVTHLIVGNIDTPKYKHTAKERPDIHVIKPEWIYAVRKLWREDQDIDVDALVQEYRLPALYNLHICVTGFDDVDQRQELIQNIESNGAIYHGDLTREVSHLIVSRPKGAKYERAKAWNLKIISLKWLEESLDRGMAVDESLYHPLMPFEDQGQGAFVRGYKRPSVLGKRQRSGIIVPLKDEAGRRKLRRTASAKLANHSQNMLTSFQSMTGDDGPEHDKDQWTESKDHTPDVNPSGNITPLISAIDTSRPSADAMTGEDQGLFSGVMCLVHGHQNRREARIHEIITSNGGQLALTVHDLFSALDDKKAHRTVLILPSQWTSDTKGSLPDVPPETWHVTEWWLERCIKQASVLSPAIDVLSAVHSDLPIDGFRDLSIATSGMGYDVLHISKVVELAGASYHETLLPRTSILVVPALTANAEKVAYAAKYRIPVVNEQWLFSCLRDARKLSPSGFGFSAFPSSKVGIGKQTGPAPAHAESALPQKENRKDDTKVQRLSAVRKRSVAPALSLYKSGPIQSSEQHKPQTKKGPFIEEDVESEDGKSVTSKSCQQDALVDGPTDVVVEDDPFLNDFQAEQPLQDLPPNMNAALRQSKASTTDGGKGQSDSISKQGNEGHESNMTRLSAGSENIDEPNAESERANKARLDGEIKSLLERQHSAPCTSEPMLKGRWRKERKLGRAPSTASSSSASASFRQAKSMNAGIGTDPGGPMDDGVPFPSQQLTYETPDAQEYRVRMSKKMGTVLMDDNIGTRVQSLGVVRDVESDDFSGVGGRVRGRQRTAKNQI